LKKHIPNFITSLNLVCGFMAIVYAIRHQLHYSAFLIGLAAIFDFLDGLAARLLRVSSQIGKQLDSLADMVTFGVVPGMILFTMLQPGYHLTVNGHTLTFGRNEYIQYIALLIPVFSAVRLAIFNIDTRQSDSFIGVPTPANSMLIGSLPLIILYQNGFTDNPNGTYSMFSYIEVIGNQWVLAGLSVLMSWLMVAELPLFALKFRSFGWQGNRLRYIFLGISLLLLAFLQFIAIPLIIFLYIVLSLFTKKKRLPGFPG
jgi:CDP-diacylglycerol--serine O-phosphatidyltransferase